MVNPTLKGRDIRDAFKGEEHHLLLVANKFQTGFDQPLLCGMYVDRRLAGIQAVQTLSRLNRAHPGKDTTYVLDFANSADEVLKAFATYYGMAELEAVTDPNIIFDLRAKLDAAGFYDDFEVNRLASILMNPQSKQGELVGAMVPVADRLLKRYSAAQAAKKAAVETEDEKAAKAAADEMETLSLFKNDLGAFVRSCQLNSAARNLLQSAEFRSSDRPRPDRVGPCAEDPERRPADHVSLEIERVVDRSMRRQKPLRRVSGLEPKHLSLAPSDRQM